MEAVDLFVNIFSNSWEKNDSLTQILKNLASYLKNVPENDSKRALEIMFNNKKGILSHINRVLLLPKKQIDYFNTSLKEAFVALQLIMEYFKDDFEPYILKIRDKCFTCIKTMCWFYARKAAGETLRKLIELFSVYDLKLSEIIEHFNVSYSRLYSKREGSVLFIVVGAAAKYSPKLEIFSNSINYIFSELLRCLKTQYKQNSEIQPAEINIYLECFLDLLQNFVPYNEKNDAKSQYFKKLYDYLFIIFGPKPVQKSVRTKALYILSSHIDHFSNFIYNDYKKWHELLNKILEESQTVTNVNALRSFYKMMAFKLSNQDEDIVFNYFKNYFEANVSSQNIPLYKLHLIIYGLGEFSIAYKKFSPSAINDLFKVISLKALSLHEKETEKNLNVDCLKALSHFLCQMHEVSSHQINLLSEISVNFIKKFPELEGNFDYEMCALRVTFANVCQLEKKFSEEYFTLFFQKGILLSCSHTLLIDVELQQELLDFSDKPISYKNYVPLWYMLFKTDSFSGNSTFSRDEIFRKFASVLILSIEKLNLNIMAQDEVFFVTMSSSLKAENEADYRFFINLVDLYTEVFERIESNLFQYWIEKFLKDFIKFSYKYPMVSGFYKLIKVIFTKLELLDSDDENSFNNTSIEIISQYLLDVTQHTSEYFGELQTACINLILSTPSLLLTNLIDDLIPVFKIAFNQGLSNISLAFSALQTVESIVNSPNVQGSEYFLKNIISFIDPYLSSEESRLNLLKYSELEKPEITEFSKTECNLEKLQTKILLFYGSLNSRILFDFIHEKSIDTNASWNKKNLLQCELLFPDIRLEINLDKFLPRILDLTTSGDRRTKISACELLHTIISIILGKKLMDQCFDKTICYIVLKLGCDVDDSIRLLYHPLVMQLSHYLSSKFMKDSIVPQDFIDELFNGLTEEFDPFFRDNCGLYLKEFVVWSIKQADQNNLSKLKNITSIIRRIIHFALYPSFKKRLAAAIAFNHLSKIFREHFFIIDLYWLEFFHAFIKSMEESNTIQILNAINHVEQVIQTKVSVFNANNRSRRKPPGFPNETLSGLLLWLFKYCGLANTKCRWKCMQIFDNLFKNVPNPESIKILFTNYTEEIISNNFDGLIDLTPYNAHIYLRSLEFYTWIIKKKYVPIERLENMKNFWKQKVILVQYFTRYLFPDKDFNHDVLFENNKKKEEFFDLKNEINLKILMYVSTILNQQITDHDIINWDGNLNKLIIYCTLCPWKLGNNYKKLLIMEKLPNQIEKLLISIVQNLQEQSFIRLKMDYLTEIKKNFLPIMEVEEIKKNKDDTIFDQFIKGIFLLRKCNFFDLKLELNITFIELKRKIEDIFKILKEEVIGDDICSELDHREIENLNRLLQFLIKDCEQEVIEILIELIINNNPLTTKSGSKISHGEYFLQLFKESIFRSFLENPALVMNTIDKYYMDHTDKMLLYIEELLSFVSHNKFKNSEVLAGTVINNFGKFFRSINNFESRETKFLNISRLAIVLLNKPIQKIDSEITNHKLQFWIIDQLIKTPDIEKKINILQNFLTHMVDEDSGENSGLLIGLKELKNYFIGNLESSESLKFQAVSCYQVLIKVLAVKKTIIIYKIIIEYCAGICKFLLKSNLKENLNLYFGGITNELAVRSLNLVYQIFLELNLNEEKLDVLKYILLPSIEVTKACIVQEFCDKNYEEMIYFVRKKIDNEKFNVFDRSKLIITKIGFYNIFELLFSQFDLTFKEIDNPTSKNGKQTLNQFILQQALDLRFNYSAQSSEEKEIARLMQCAAFNCCITVTSLKREETFYKWIFIEKRAQGQFVWEKIIDCQKKYDFRETSSTIRKNRKKLINIRKIIKNDSSDEILKSLFHWNDPTALSLLEDIHAYDLNNLIVSVQLAPESIRRLNLSFENDELNDHECMPMICGLLIHIFNNEISKLPVENQEISSKNLPDYLKHLQSGFATKEDNVRLFLLKIISNTKNAFLPYMKAFFPAVAQALCNYLESNFLNYVIRDTLVIIIESKVELAEVQEKTGGQLLLQRLIDRARDSHYNVYKYNLELIESLFRMWISQLQYPANLDIKIRSDPELALQILVILLRCRNDQMSKTIKEKPYIYEFIKNSIKDSVKDNESLAILKFEAMGWMFYLNDEESCQKEIPFLVLLMTEIEKHSRERCAKCACVLYQICRSEKKCQRLLEFAQPSKLADSYKLDCLELFLLRLPEVAKSGDNLIHELQVINLEQFLQERVPGCESLALNIVLTLISDKRYILDEAKFQSYVDIIITSFTGFNSSVLEHRKIAFSIMMKAYERYPPPDHALGIISARVLVRALEDPMEEIQEYVLSFWKENINLPETSCERLITILDMYSPELQASYERFLCLMMLQLTAKSLDINRVMFSPLTDCTYRDLQLLVSRRRLDWGSKAPLFVSSLTSQLTQFVQLSQFNQNPEPSQLNFFSNSIKLLATKELEFASTAASQFPNVQSRNLSSSLLPDPSQNQLSKRNFATIRNVYNAQINDNKMEIGNRLKNEIINRQKSVKIHRKYRNGDFPDVEITHANFIDCLKQLIINDWFSCKNLVVTLVCSLIQRLKDSNKYSNFKNSISNFFEKTLESQNEKNYFAHTVLEIIYRTKEMIPEPKNITKICNEMGFYSLGILLLEEACLNENIEIEEIDDDSLLPSKRMKKSASSVEKWIELAMLYKKIGKEDIVNSIFKYNKFFTNTIREGVLAQAKKDWISAKSYYEKTDLILSAEQDYCLQNLFECLSQLSSWNEINNKIEERLEEDYNSVWECSKKKELLPWIFEAQLHSALDDYTSNKDLQNRSFIENFESWIGSRDAEMKQYFGEEISVIYLCGNETEAKSLYCLKSCCDHIRKLWMRLNPFAETEKLKIIYKLERIYNIYAYLKILNSSDFDAAIKCMLNCWEKGISIENEDLFYINKNTVYKLTFGQLLQEKLAELPEYIGLYNEVTHANVKLRIKMGELAIENKNKSIAKKHISQAEYILNEIESENLSFIMVASKYKFLCGLMETNMKKKYKYFINAWEFVNNILEKENVVLTLKKNVYSHLFDITSALRDETKKNMECIDYIINNDFLNNLLNLVTNSYDEVLKTLEKYGYDCLKQACEVEKSTNMADAHLKFGQYCYSILGFKKDFILFEEFISSILHGMSIGSLDAAYYFPCLLKNEYYQNNERIAKLFIEKSNSVPSWLFLNWQTQIMSYLGQSLAYIVTNIIERLITDYPNGVMFNFRLLYDSVPGLKSNTDICRMYKSLFGDPKIEFFFDALHRVCQPEYFLRYYVLELYNSQAENFQENLHKFLSMLDFNSTLYGVVYKEIKKYQSNFLNLKNLNFSEAKKNLLMQAQTLYDRMTQRLSDSRRAQIALQLKEYSPYLSNFSGDDLEIEIPGQYEAHRKPIPRYHVKISKFDRFVAVMKSKCFPVKITAIGNDANTYSFLVKFGDDLRQDQRLQQVFTIINKTLSLDKNCKQKYLSINTYYVAPLSTSLGLIQWIDQTKSLKEFIEFSMPDKTILKNISKKYETWIQAAGSSRNPYENYKTALIKYNSKEVTLKMKELISSLDTDYFRNTFSMISPSLECFVSLRQNFITNYATMCIVHWIAGVGDRHMENMLIEVKTGKCFGIDFGLAFGAGIDQTPPELVPFRLTPQILGLLKPFNENAFLGSTMTFVLEALREERNRLLACFDVFIHEPLNWTKHVNENEGDEYKISEDIKWLPENKLKIIKKKLNGTKPSIITCEELSETHEISLYKNLVDGTDSSHKTMRATIKNDSLSSEEQVQCLLDQAKDLNLLGRMYVGWQPFI